ncbi:aminotransferase class I/II-fold pyridoxal phosphate-dependent enzyme [Kineococcus sp. NUM-3379]
MSEQDATGFAVRGGTAAELAASVEHGVTSGALAPGEALPSVRALAAACGVAPGTVAAAYRTLRERGVVEAGTGQRTRVRRTPAVHAPRSRLALPVPPGARDLSTGGPAPHLLPAPHPPRDGDPRGYPDSPLDAGLLAAARERLRADAVPDTSVLCTGGALDGIERVLAAHLRPGDAVAVEDPGWTNLLDLLAACGLPAVPVAVDDEGPLPRSLAGALTAGARAVVVTSRAQNPTGAAVSAARAAELRDVLAGHPHVLVVEDDHAAELAAVPLAPLAGAVPLWAFVRSVSKPYGPDLRLAVVAADPVTAARAAGRQGLGPGWVSHLLQRTVAALWADPGTAALVAGAGRTYDARRDGLVAALARHGVRAHGRTGINVWVPVDDETGAAARLAAAGWVPAPGARFRLRSGPGLRLTVSTLAADDVEPLAAAVAGAVRPAGGRPGA